VASASSSGPAVVVGADAEGLGQRPQRREHEVLHPDGRRGDPAFVPEVPEGDSTELERVLRTPGQADGPMTGFRPFFNPAATVLLYPADRGRPRAHRMLTDPEPDGAGRGPVTPRPPHRNKGVPHRPWRAGPPSERVVTGQDEAEAIGFNFPANYR
jgi:hypothetical protein